MKRELVAAGNQDLLTGVWAVQKARGWNFERAHVLADVWTFQRSSPKDVNKQGCCAIAQR
jgi:hypothetical protein